MNYRKKSKVKKLKGGSNIGFTINIQQGPPKKSKKKSNKKRKSLMKGG
jgi:hypothetical protein